MPGEKADIVRRDDNLQPEGDFSKRPQTKWQPGERSNIVRRDDNLHPEGDFHKRTDLKWKPGDLKIVHIRYF